MLTGEPNGGTAAVLVGMSPGEAARRGGPLRLAQGLPEVSAAFLQLADPSLSRELTRHRLERSPLAPRDRGES